MDVRKKNGFRKSGLLSNFPPHRCTNIKPETPQMSREDHNLLYVHCKMKLFSWSVVATYIEKIDIGTGVRRTPTPQAMNKALKKWGFQPMIINEQDRIERSEVLTLLEDQRFVTLSMKDTMSKGQRENIDSILGIGSSALAS